MASRELVRERFANENSAQNSIRDACSRRLNLTIAEFDAAVALLLSGDSARLQAILAPIPGYRDHRAALAQLLASPIHDAIDIEDAASPERRETVVNRIIRDTAMVRVLKRQYQNQCQICGVAIKVGEDQTYSEGHHIRPLGQPHNGPDTADNIIILCPNHHAQCDFRAIKLDLASLRCLPDHVIDQEHIAYHNEYCGDGVRS